MSEDKPSIRDIILTWRVKHGDRFYKRPEQLDELFSTIVSYGYSKKDITPSIQKHLVEVMYNSNWPTAKKWRQMVENDVLATVVGFWPPAKLVEHNPEHRELKTVQHEKPEFRRAPAPGEPPSEEPQEKLLDLDKLKEGIETTELLEGELLQELGIKKDGR